MIFLWTIRIKEFIHQILLEDIRGKIRGENALEFSDARLQEVEDLRAFVEGLLGVFREF